MPGWPAAAEEPERRQLLQVEPGSVHFRHELARNVIRSSLPAAARRRLHAEVLGALVAAEADPADIVHHAEAAGAEDVVSEYALVAARRAATLESNREAYSHFRRASDFFDRLDPDALAEALEELALAAYLVGRLDDAFAAIEQAIEIHAGAGDSAAIGRCTRVLSRLHWFTGDGEPARARGTRGGRDPRAARRVGRARACLQRRLPARHARGRHRPGGPLGRARARAGRPARG